MKKINHKLNTQLLPHIYHKYENDPTLFVMEKVNQDSEQDTASLQQLLI
jgi:hypothetical protein